MIISIGITRGEFHFYGDEMRHSFTGVFFRDLMVDRPLENPKQYAYEYYSKYPALGVPHWPPFFYAVEGLFFLVFGLHAWVSRLAILCFSLLGIYFWYRIAELEGPRHRALLSALVFPLVPYVLLYERVTMLEIPMVSLCLAAIYFWRRFLAAERRLHLLAMAGFAAAAMLTSQKAIFLVFLVGLDVLVERRFRLLRRWDLWLAAAASVAIVIPWYRLSFGTSALTYQRATGSGANFLGFLSNWEHWAFYPYHLSRQVGVVLAVLALGGAFWAALRERKRYTFLLVWLLATYFCFTLIQEKDLRHSMIWIPPMVYFALVAIETLCARRRWALVVSAGLAAYFLVGALRFERPKLAGAEDAAKYVTSQPESDIIYYQGQLNGNFIFYVRKFDPERRRLVAREKQIVATNIVSAYGTREIIQTPEQVLNFVRTWGIRYLVLENHDFMGGLAVVRRTVSDSGEFELVREFPLWTNNPAAAGQKLLVYRYKGEIRRTNEPVVIPMMTIHSDIKVNLSRLAGRPWPN